MNLLRPCLPLLALSITGCAQSLPLELRFPSTNTFLVATEVRIRVYDTSASSCPQLVTAVSGGSMAPGTALSSVTYPTCSAYAGAAVPDPGSGRRSILVEALNRNGTATILVGCTEAEAYPGAPPITVALYPTSNYATELVANPPVGTIADRCGGGV